MDARTERGFHPGSSQAPHRRDGRLHHTGPESSPSGVNDTGDPLGTAEADRGTVGGEHR